MQLLACCADEAAMLLLAFGSNAVAHVQLLCCGDAIRIASSLWRWRLLACSCDVAAMRLQACGGDAASNVLPRCGGIAAVSVQRQCSGDAVTRAAMRLLTCGGDTAAMRLRWCASDAAASILWPCDSECVVEMLPEACCGDATAESMWRREA